MNTKTPAAAEKYTFTGIEARAVGNALTELYYDIWNCCANGQSFFSEADVPRDEKLGNSYLGDLFFELAEYAWGGVAGPGLDRFTEIGMIADLINKNVWVPDEIQKPIYQLNSAVVGRWNLDEPEEAGGQLTIEELAALAGIAEKTLRSFTNPRSSNPLVITKLGHWTVIDGPDALNWLSKRADWKPTNNQEPPKSAGLENGGYLFVPKAADGSIFSPECRQKNGFRIGPKGNEVLVESFEEALQQLGQMPKPYWRRPNQNGKFGIVSGSEFIRVHSSEVQVRSSLRTIENANKEDNNA